MNSEREAILQQGARSWNLAFVIGSAVKALTDSLLLPTFVLRLFPFFPHFLHRTWQLLSCSLIKFKFCRPPAACVSGLAPFGPSSVLCLRLHPHNQAPIVTVHLCPTHCPLIWLLICSCILLINAMDDLSTVWRWVDGFDDYDDKKLSLVKFVAEMASPFQADITHFKTLFFKLTNCATYKNQQKLSTIFTAH